MQDANNQHDQLIKNITEAEYKYGFESNIKQELAPKGLNEDIIKYISNKKNEPQFMLD